MNNINFPRLYPIVNFTPNKDNIKLAEELVSSDIKILQIRAKNYSYQEVSLLVNKIIEFKYKKNPNLKLLINDHLDIAKNQNIDGVHLGQNDFSVINARDILGDSKIIGHSTHSIEQINKAPFEKLNYLAIGPIFDSKTKFGHSSALGLGIIPEAIKCSKVPLVAIGGITIESAKTLFDLGINSVAVISELENANDVKRIVNMFNEI